MAHELTARRWSWQRGVAAAELVLCVAPLALFSIKHVVFFFSYGARTLATGLQQWLPQLIKEGCVVLFWATGILLGLTALGFHLVTAIRTGSAGFARWQILGLLAWTGAVAMLADVIDNMTPVLPFTVACAVVVGHRLFEAWRLRERP